MEWKEYKLSDVCLSIADGDHMPPPKSKSGVPFITIANISNYNTIDFRNSFFVPEEYYNRLDFKRKPQLDDIIYSVVGTFGKPVHIYSNFPFVFQRHIAILRPNKEVLSSKFLFYTLLSPAFYKKADNMAVGAVQRTISLTSLRNCTINVPPIDIQKRIADILSSLDAKIENNNKINAKLEEVAQALFKSWFIDFEPFKVGSDGSQPALGSGKFVESELGMIPEGWKVGFFTEIMDIKPGGTPKTNIEEYWDKGSIPFFSPKDVTDSIYTFVTEKNITELGLKNCSSQLYPKNTVFITARGTVGKVALSACDMAMNQSNYALVVKDGFTQQFLYFVTLKLVEILKKKSNGAVFSAITGKDFKELIVIPPKDIVLRFTILVNSIFETVYSNCLENSNLARTRDTLLPKLMSGEIEL